MFMSEVGRLIDNFSELCNDFNKEGYLVTIDFEKAFDLVNCVFLTEVIKKNQLWRNIYGMDYDFT